MNRKCFFIAILIFAFFYLIFYLFPNFLLLLELKVHDSFLNTSRKLNRFSPHLNEIVIIAVDDLSYRKLQKQWPFSRATYADLLNKIYSSSPKVIVFDVVFRGEGEDIKGDELFAQALKDKDNVLLPYHVGKLGVEIKSKEEFTANVGLAGYINKPLDIDGSMRRFYPFRLSIEGKIEDYALESYVFSKYYNYDLKNIVLKNNAVSLNQLETKAQDLFKDFKFPLLRDRSMWINYQAKLDDFNVISLFKVLSDAIDPNLFKDKVVLIGPTSAIVHDIHATPLGFMPGVFLVANTALMFLDGRFIFEIDDWIKWLIIFGLCLLMIFLCYRLGMIKGLLFTISIITIITTITFFLFVKKYYLNPFKLILICIVSYIVINFYKYTSVVLENMHLRKLSTVDELTGLYIFRFFQVVLNHEFQKSLRYKTTLSLLMFDIDNFKKINDVYGHQKGNVVLNKIGKIILKNVRRADFPARYGGEELAILLPNSNIEGAQSCAENLRKLIEKEDFFMTAQGPLKATVSVGISSFPVMNITSPEEMIKFADSALYKAKREGKNRVVVYNEGI